MISLGAATRVFLALAQTHLRKSFEGLSSLAKHQFQKGFLSGHLFVFTKRSRKVCSAAKLFPIPIAAEMR